MKKSIHYLLLLIGIILGAAGATATTTLREAVTVRAGFIVVGGELYAAIPMVSPSAQGLKQ